MSGHIAVIDPDPVFAGCLSRRLLHLMPQSHIILYSPEDITRDPSLVLTEDVILYDDLHMDLITLQGHTSTSGASRMIPLHTQGSLERRKITGTEISRIVSGGSDNVSDSLCRTGISLPSDRSIFEKPPVEPQFFRPEGQMRILLSFADRPEREKYYASCIKALLSRNLRIIRLDLMSGISMVNPFHRNAAANQSRGILTSGISELLLKLDSVRLEPDDLWDYVQLGQDGCYHFGLPLRADDVLCCRPEILVRLLHLLRRIADTPDENTAVIVVIESLPFCVLKQVCSLSHELHIIMPPRDFSDANMCEWELTDLFSSLPPNLLKFFSETGKAAI